MAHSNLNTVIIKEFKKLARQIKLDINNKLNIINSFRLQSILKIINILEKFPEKITNNNLNQLKNISGIGNNTIARIKEILNTGKLSEIKQDIEFIDELEKVFGIGHKTASNLIKNYNIKSIKELKDLVKNKKIDLPQNIVKGLKYYGKIKDNIPRNEIDSINNYIQEILRKIDPELFGIICGSYRRLKLTSNDIDILIIHPRTNYLKEIVNYLIKEKFIIESFTDNNNNNNNNTKYMGLCQYNNNPIRRIDIRFIPYESYYYAMLYFTGSKDFNKKMRMVAVNMGYLLNEYGLYKNNKLFKANSEKEIFDYLNLEYVDPQFRN